jgi:hypothetical protein
MFGKLELDDEAVRYYSTNNFFLADLLTWKSKSIPASDALSSSPTGAELPRLDSNTASRYSRRTGDYSKTS